VSAGCKRGVDAWDQHAWVWDAAFYSLLALITALGMLDDAASAQDRWLMLALTVVTAGWHLAFQLTGIDEERPRRVLVYVGGLVVLWFFLAGVHPVYFSLLLIVYPQIFRFLRLPLAVPASVALTVLVVLREVLESGRPLSENWPAIGGGLISVVFGTLFAFWLTRIIQQSYERRQLIEQLEATRGELAEAEREGGRLAERQRLARDIHDTLAQGFAGIVLQLQAAEGELPAGADAARRHLEQARRTARENLAEARRLVWALRPEPLRAASLGEALGRLTGRLAEETGMAATATVTGTPRPLTPDAEITLLRVTQEALANVRKHAGASRVALTLSYMDGEAALDVRDDGAGFALGPDGYGPNGGLGLRGMRERVEALGGRLAVESASGRGTSIAVSFPVDPEGCGEPQRGAPVDREGSGEPQRGVPVDREGSGEPQGDAPVDPEGSG
jgi:signal transduction histidine kinase